MQKELNQMERIFIVDDNQFYTNIVEAKLREISGYTIEKYLTGQDCINNAFKQPEIIFLDYHLGDTNGFEVLKEIKSTYPDIHVVMLSGQTEMKVAINSLRFGATDYLLKDTDDTEIRLKKIVQDCQQISNARKKLSWLLKVNSADYS